MKTRAIVLVGVIAVLILGFYSWGYLQKVLNRGKIQASGTIEAVEVQVGSKVSGKVMSLNVNEGQTVKKDDIIAVVDVPEIDAQLSASQARENAAKANSENAQTDFERAAKLYKDGMTSDQQYDSSRTMANNSKQNFLEAKAQKESIEIQKDNATIKAPISGTILVKAVEAGELVSYGSTIVTMADIKQLELKVYVNETEVGKINLGDTVLINIDSFPGEKFKGNVSYISPKAEFTPKNIQTKEERVNQVFEIKVDIPNNDLRLKAGLPADAEILAGQRP